MVAGVWREAGGGWVGLSVFGVFGWSGCWGSIEYGGVVWWGDGDAVVVQNPRSPGLGPSRAVWLGPEERWVSKVDDLDAIDTCEVSSHQVVSWRSHANMVDVPGSAYPAVP